MDNEENKQQQLTDEEVWLKYILALASNPNLVTCDVESDALLADDFLREFKKRFRND